VSILSHDYLLQVVGERRLRQLTDDEATGEVVWDTIDEICESVDAAIESYAGGQYSTPLPANATVTGIALKLFKFEIYSRREDELPKNVELGYKAAMSLLKDVREGRAEIKGATRLHAASSMSAPTPESPAA